MLFSTTSVQYASVIIILSHKWPVVFATLIYSQPSTHISSGWATYCGWWSSRFSQRLLPDG